MGGSWLSMGAIWQVPNFASIWTIVCRASSFSFEFSGRHRTTTRTVSDMWRALLLALLPFLFPHSHSHSLDILEEGGGFLGGGFQDSST